MNYFLFLDQKLTSTRSRESEAGFTLIELIVVIVMVGILSAIVAPSWISFLNQRRVNAAENAIFRAINQAQSQAKATNQPYSVSFRMDNGIPQAAVYQAQYVNPSSANAEEIWVDPTSTQFKFWKNLGENIDLKSGQVLLGTNMTQANRPNTATNTYQYGTNLTISRNSADGANHTITFDETGILMPTTDPNLGQNNQGLIITVAQPKGGSAFNQPAIGSARCVKVLTLIGSLKTDRGAACQP
ncbi:MAG: type II secretion system protein [Jaaginema sp. PMC 1079.18]|nr:type II secretion system protein [Jaaginema sp. PMC 1080.18]MEC4850544.1 type II secretion system protein [Jaaginema sp. PMC 1079.18]MEC4867664.1 type II secretion system protein [Jaaginema sp. PMC 1078.18]